MKIEALRYCELGQILPFFPDGVNEPQRGWIKVTSVDRSTGDLKVSLFDTHEAAKDDGDSYIRASNR